MGDSIHQLQTTLEDLSNWDIPLAYHLSCPQRISIGEDTAPYHVEDVKQHAEKITKQKAA